MTITFYRVGLCGIIETGIRAVKFGHWRAWIGNAHTISIIQVLLSSLWSAHVATPSVRGLQRVRDACVTVFLMKSHQNYVGRELSART